MYESEVILGEKYVDKQSGVEGIAVSVTFYQHGCERVALERVVDGDLREYCFDSPRLTSVKAEEQVSAKKTGGPQRTASHVRPGPLSRG